MARNSENAPSEPSARRRRPPEEGGSHLRQHFRDSIRDALSGVDVDELQGKGGLPVASDVSLLTREVVDDLEVELAKLRAERAQLEQRTAGAGGAPVEPPQPRAGRRAWRRGRGAPAPEQNGAMPDVAAPSVAWSVARAMEPVAEGFQGAAPGVASDPAAPASPAPGEPGAAPQVPEPPRPTPAAPGAFAPPAATPQSAPKSRPTAPTGAPKRRAQPQRRSTLSDAELESVVAPLLAELADLRAEVRDLRGDPDQAHPARRPNHQMVKLVAGVLVGFALIVIALAVVLKA